MRQRFALLLALTACSGTDGIVPSDGARILSFTASPDQIRAGETATLTWEAVGTNGVAIEPQVGLQAASGSTTVRPIATTTYTLTVLTGAGERLTSQATVKVEGGPPRIERFTAMPRTIQAGESSTLEWSAVNASTVTIEPDVGVQPAVGTIAVSPEVTTTYRLVATGDVGSATQEVTVVVASGNQPFIRSFGASPQAVAPGDKVTLTWETQNADGVTINPEVGPQPPTGSVDVNPTQTTVYTLTASGPGGQATASVTVQVTSGADPVILRFLVAPAVISAGGSAEMSWETDNATGVLIEPDIGPQAAKDTLQVSPLATTTYTLTAFGTSRNVTAQVTLTVAGGDDPVVTRFVAQPQAVIAGGSTTLSWETQNATSVDIDTVGTGLMANGSVQVTPAQTTTYRLTARGAGTPATATVDVTVTAAAPVIDSFTAQPTAAAPGQTVTLSWTTQNATMVTIDNAVGAQPASGAVQVMPAVSTTYVLTAVSPGGQTTAQVTVNVQAPGAPVIDSFFASPQQIAPGSQATLTWQTTGATAVRIDNGVGVVPATGQVDVTPQSTTTYTLTADGAGGSSNAQVTVTVASANGDQCSSAFEILQSGQFAGNTQTAVNDYSDSTSCTGYTSAGPDQVYRVSLQANDRLRATLTPQTAWDASLYLVTSCATIGQSCVAGEDNGNPEIVDYVAPSAGTYYLVVDGYSASSGGNYLLDVVLNPAPIANDQCGGAINVGAGGTFTGNTRFAVNDYNPGSGGCTRYAEASGDVTYRVSLAQGERLQATLTAAWDSALYVVGDCGMVPSSCVAGSDSGNPERIDYTATAAGTYFIIVDGYGNAGGDFSLNVTISPPVQGGETCTNAVAIPAGGGSFMSTTTGLANDYAPPLSCTGFPAAGPDRVYAMNLGRGDVIEALAEFSPTLDGAIYLLTDCANLMSCTAGTDRELAGGPELLRHVARQAGTHHLVVDAELAASAGDHELTVATYTGETCATAAPLFANNQPEWTITTGRVNDYSPNAGGCTGFSASGEDRAYAINLRAGDQLEAALTPDTGYDASLYLVSSCADISGSCVAGSDRTGNVVERIAPVVQQAGVYYLIVDGFAGSDGTGTLTATIAHGDTCADAYAVPATGGTFLGTTAGYAANYGTNTRTGSCTNWQQDGSDAVYRVNLANNQRITASVTTTWDAALYLISDCAQSATSCVAGQDDGNPEAIDFTNTSGQTRTYYLVVDSWRTGATYSGNYSLSITIQ